MPSDLPNGAPVAVISGANRGIGLATARELLGRGYRLSLGARDPDRMRAALPAPEDSVLVHTFDALAPQTAADWIAATVARFGRIDALINNAGSNERVTLEDDDDDALDRLWAINVKAPLRLTRLCLPHLEATGRGRVVNIASLSGKRVRNPHVGYAMTKFAVMGLTHTIRHVAWPKGIRATALCPSFVRTDMTDAVTKISRAEMTDPETIATLIRTVIELPNTAAVAELLVNCRQEDML
ncbi:SDR family NAD(P)-dependent oxidoreductase [Frigidibacter sp. MR17.14]|uniref:SDR family NAD(P)-dependent oxidoreductase n=1 Tax=Frigidibacter sp. MR17.14 TaxID=3126509 RepID=UPI003012F403